MNAFNDLLWRPALAALFQRLADAGIRIFHLDARDRVFEHWDLLQLVPEEPANDCK